MAALSCGIDFGTSNSTVALADAQGARLIPLEGGEATLPSAVFWSAEGEPPEFGRAAIAAYVQGVDGRLMRGLKSTLGSGLIHEKTSVGGRAVALRDVLARYFRHLKARLDATAPGITSVVLGRPVHFVEGDAAADLAAVAVLEDVARSVGFREVAFQFEPIAAALQYEQGVAGEEVVLIVDIGGGTSDFSVLRVSPERAGRAERAADILGNHGIRVGGTDFDRLLSLAEVMPHLGYLSGIKGGKALMPRHYYLDLATWHRINSVYTRTVAADLKALEAEADHPERIARLRRVIAARAGHGVAMAVEAAKIALSDEAQARIALSALTGGPNPVVTRAAFEAAVAAPAARIRTALTDVLAQAGLTPAAITTVFMTGGSSGLPLMRRLVGEALPHARLATGDMLGSVGTGLALEARARFG